MFQFEYSNKVRAMRPSIIRELLKQMADPTLISFAGGNPDTGAFPAAEIREISGRLLAGPPGKALQYSITEGTAELRALGTRYLNSQGPVVKEFDDVMVVSGGQQVMDFLTRLLCNDGDVVATEDPAFLGALNAFRGGGAKLVGVALEPDGPNLAMLEAVLTASQKPKFFYTIPNFQNPTGVTSSLEKRRAVYALCKKHGVPILEDNPYGELRFAGQDLPPIKSFDDEGLVVYAASLSKVFAPGMRIALCAGAKALIARMTVAKQGCDVHSNLWAQRVIEEFYKNYDFEAHIARLRGVYREKAVFMMRCLDEKLAGKLDYVPVEGGMFLWLNLPAAVAMSAFVQRCLERKLALVPGNAFFVDDQTPCQSVRCNFSTPTLEQIDQGTTIMREVMDEMLQEA